MQQVQKTWSMVLRCLCSVALAIMALPLCAAPAYAGTIGAGKSFSVDNLTYLITAGNNVVVSGVVDKEALPGTLTIPSTVNYGDEDHSAIDYKIIGIYEKAFRDCKNLVDVRVPDLGDGRVYGVAFDGCSNLKVIHFLGNADFANPGRSDGANQSRTDATDFGSVTDLKLVFHKQSFNFFSEGAFNGTNCLFPIGTKAYFPCDFVQGDKTTTVYIAGVETTTGIETDRKALTTPAGLADASSVDVYCDAEKGVDSLCPIGSVPELEEGYDAWVASKKGDSSEFLSPGDNIEFPIVANAFKSTDMAGAIVVAEDLLDLGQEIKPQVTVTTARGAVLVEDEDYTVSFALANNGEDATASENASNDTYKTYEVTATGIGEYTGSCSCEMKVYNYNALWYRAWSSSEYGNPMAIVSQAASVGSKAVSDASNSNVAVAYRGQGVSGGINNSARIVVNAEDYTSCLIAESLASLFDVSIITVPKTLSSDGLPADVKIQLSAIRNGVALVLGTKDYISDEVKNAVSSSVNGGASRIGGNAADAAQTAVEAYNFIRAVEDGTYSLSLPSTYSTYGSTAMVIPSSAENAAMFTAAAWAYSNNAAIFFCDSDGRLSAETIEALKGVDSKTSQAYFTKVVVPGGSAAAVDAVEKTLTDVEVSQWAGSDSNVYESSLLWAGEAAKNGSTYKATVFTFADAGWGNLAAAACSAGLLGGNLLVVDFSNGASGLISTVESLRYEIGYGIIAANYEQCEPEVYERMIRWWDYGENASDVNLRTSEITVLTPEIECTGKAVKPAIKVVDKNGKELAEGTDYTVSYFDNVAGKSISAEKVVNPGSYSVVITGTYKYISGGFGGDTIVSGYYKGSRSATFKVTGTVPSSEPAKAPAAAKAPVPGKASVKSLTCGKKKLAVKWRAVSGATKYQVSYRVKGTKKWKTASAKGAKLTVSKLKKGKAYQVRVRAGNGSGWGAWSAVKTSKKVK